MYDGEQRSTIPRKSAEDLEMMAAAGDILARCLKMLRARARAGVTTGELDTAADKFIAAQGATPAFKGYRGFPASVCTSPNSMVVHGIPGSTELRKGDILTIDVGVIKDGWVADAAITVPVGAISADTQALLETTRESLFAAIDQARPGNHLGDIGHAVEERVARDGYQVIRSLVGHGIGRSMHEEPQVPNYGTPGTGPELAEGMTFAIEPMVNAGDPEVRMGSDGWAVYSRDGSMAAHFEFTVAVTAEGPRILTPWHLDE